MSTNSRTLNIHLAIRLHLGLGSLDQVVYRLAFSQIRSRYANSILDVERAICLRVQRCRERIQQVEQSPLPMTIYACETDQ
jgi:hypothetical protein